MKNTFSFFTASAILIVGASTAFADFKRNEIAKVEGVTCGYSNSWFPVNKSKGKFIKTKKPSVRQKAACKNLVAPTKVNLAKLPSISKIASSGASSSSFQSIQSVSGTPPTLSEIVTTGPTTVFWRPGVVSSIASGSPTPEQCSEFFTGASDGQSGGFLSCYLNQNAGQALAEVVRSGTTMCYLKNMPTTEVAAAGGFQITRGTLPGGQVTNLFKTPAGSTPRVVRISLGAEANNGTDSDGIIRISAANQISSSGDLYKYEMIFCDGDATEPQEIEKTRITSSAEFISSSFNTSEGGNSRFAGTVRAFLRLEGSELVFDNSRSRTASFVSTHNREGSPSSRASDITITGDNRIISKEYNIEAGDTRKAYSISRFSGSGMSSLRFFEGAIKQTFAFGDFNGATEYRDTAYVTAPTNSYVEQLSAVDITSDPFYSGTPSPEEGAATLRCDTRADIEVTVDMENDAMRAVTASCESERLDNVNFCQDTQLTQAQERFNSVCSRS